MKDDIIGTAPVKKLIAHIIVAFILVVMADLRIESMHGIFGVTNPLSLWQSYMLSILAYLVIINSINLIDGLDGLAGLVSLLASVFFGILFYYSGNIPLSLLALFWLELCWDLSSSTFILQEFLWEMQAL